MDISTDVVTDPETGSDTNGNLTFPDLPRLELDQLLTQLVDRAGEVLSTQGRLRGLLRANQTISVDLALPVVLRRIVSAARELVGARYAALGVIARTACWRSSFMSGWTRPPSRRIGQLPQGKGLLGALIADPRPIRSRTIAEDPRSSGFPDGHPPMSELPGVPIRVRGVVFGNLYLTESIHGEFSSEDEELATRWPRRRGWRSTTPGSTRRPRRDSSGCRPPRRSPAGCCPRIRAGRSTSSPNEAGPSPPPTSSPCCCRSPVGPGSCGSKWRSEPAPPT